MNTIEPEKRTTIMTRASITEDSKVKLRISTAWAIFISVIGTSVWMTGLVFEIKVENEKAHEKLFNAIVRVEERTKTAVTTSQMEGAFAYVLGEAHKRMTNYNFPEYQVLEGVRQRLKDPYP